MDIIKTQEKTQALPQLIKQSATYKIVVPKMVEEKIRYLCRKFPSLEWSGVLFTTHEGTFEDNNLVITCQDIYPMDLGSPGFTQFRMDETVAAYIAENIELFDADISLIHSHNSMDTFFSGQDQATLREEGNDRNCFVSLIVNNAGTYCAAITRKVHKKTEVATRNLGRSYEFFGEGAISDNLYDEESRESEDTVIEYFMLDVEVEKVDNPLDYLDARFDEIEAKKKERIPVASSYNKQPIRVYDPKKGDTVLSTTSSFGSDYDKDKDFYDWIHENRKQEQEQPTLFTKEEMGDVDLDKWDPDPAIIHHLVVQLVTSSLIVSPDIDLKQWIVRHMEKKYKEIFEDLEEFERWADSMVEFIVSHFNDPTVPAEVYDDWDFYTTKVCEALIEELQSYPSNYYLAEYIDLLSRRAYE